MLATSDIDESLDDFIWKSEERLARILGEAGWSGLVANEEVCKHFFIVECKCLMVFYFYSF